MNELALYIGSLDRLNNSVLDLGKNMQSVMAIVDVAYHSMDNELHLLEQDLTEIDNEIIRLGYVHKIHLDYSEIVEAANTIDTLNQKINDLHNAKVPVTYRLRSESPVQEKNNTIGDLSKSVINGTVKTVAKKSLDFLISKKSFLDNFLDGLVDVVSKSLPGILAIVAVGMSQPENITRLENVAIDWLNKIPWMVQEIEPTLRKAFDTVQSFIPLMKDSVLTGWHIIQPVLQLVMSTDFKNLVKNTIDTSLALVNTLIPAINMAAEALVPLARLLNRGVGVIHNIIYPPNAQPGGKLYPRIVGDNKVAGWNEKKYSNASIAAYAISHHLNRMQAYNYALSQQMKRNASHVPGVKISAFDVGFGFRFDKNPGSYVGNILKGISNRKGNRLTNKDSYTGAVLDRGTSITSGGKRKIIININKSFVENFTINAKEVKEGYDNLRLRVEEIFLEILNSANAVGA